MTGDTNWTPYSVPELAAILDDDLTSAWEQVGAWFSADAMLDDAASKLAEARSGLAAVWPPESSPAAQTFFQVVDALTESMTKTALAANTNANALSQVLDNHTDTKSKVDGLHSAWTVNQKLAPADPDVFANPAQWQSGLNAQAQQHMTAADNVINEYASTLVVPPVIPVPGWFDPVTVIPGSDGTSATPGGGGPTSGLGGPGGGVPPTTGGGSATVGPGSTVARRSDPHRRRRSAVRRRTRAAVARAGDARSSGAPRRTRRIGWSGHAERSRRSGHPGAGRSRSHRVRPAPAAAQHQASRAAGAPCRASPAARFPASPVVRRPPDPVAAESRAGPAVRSVSRARPVSPAKACRGPV